MDKVLTVAQTIAPIFVTLFLGAFSRRKAMIKPEEIQGLQQFVMKFGLPCVLFNSCLAANIGPESISTMALLIPLMVISTLLGFRARKKRYPYYNLPMLFAAKESGMMGIPLYLILFGADQVYRMGVLDLAQATTAISTIAILSASADSNPTPGEIAKKILTSPFLVMSLLGLALNLTGVADWMNHIGIGAIITESTGFLAQPVSAMMIFCIGYNFSLEKGNRSTIFKLSAIHFLWFAVICLIMQLALFLLPNVDSLTRWAVLMYTTLPASYLAPSLGRNKEEHTIASGICSILSVTSLIIFCIIAVIVV